MTKCDQGYEHFEQEVTGQIIAWQDPPASGNGHKGGRIVQKWGAVADALRARPGQWALILLLPAADGKRNSTASSLSTIVRKGQGGFAPAGGFEAAQRTAPGGEVGVFARYVGDQGA